MLWKLLARLLVPIQEIRTVPVWAEATETALTIKWGRGIDQGYYEEVNLQGVRVTRFGEE